MKKIELNYSPRNIPLGIHDSYLKSLMSKSENFLRNLRWKAFFYDNPAENGSIKNTFGFKSSKSPPKIKDLANFENDLYDIISSIKFRKTSNVIQDKMRKDLNEIGNSNMVVVPADKSNNFYKINIQDYDKTLRNNITKDYKKASKDLRLKIDEETAVIATDLKLADRMENYQLRKPFILLKDHKEGFTQDPKCRLINPAKTDLGKISKQILEKITLALRNVTNLNQWRNTTDVISWFEKQHSPNSKFLQFDIESFYPSISEELFNRSLSFAQLLIEIADEEIRIIRHFRKTLLIEPNGHTWTKRTPLSMSQWVHMMVQRYVNW